MNSSDGCLTTLTTSTSVSWDVSLGQWWSTISLMSSANQAHCLASAVRSCPGLWLMYLYIWFFCTCCRLFCHSRWSCTLLLALFCWLHPLPVFAWLSKDVLFILFFFLLCFLVCSWNCNLYLSFNLSWLASLSCFFKDHQFSMTLHVSVSLSLPFLFLFS